MFKKIYLKNIIFLIFLMFTFLVLISTSSGCLFDETKKIDSGKKIIKVKNEKFQIIWESEQVIDHDKKYVSISYKSMKNKKNKGSIFITINKTSENKINIKKHLPSMIFSTDEIIKTKINSDKYYWKKLRPQISYITKNSILNKKMLIYNKNRYFHETNSDSIINKTVINHWKLNCKVYFYSKTSSVEILKRPTSLNKYKLSSVLLLGQNINIYQYSKGKLRIDSVLNLIFTGGGSTPMDFKYVKTNLSPKQYFLQVYKKKLEEKR